MYRTGYVPSRQGQTLQRAYWRWLLAVSTSCLVAIPLVGAIQEAPASALETSIHDSPLVRGVFTHRDLLQDVIAERNTKRRHRTVESPRNRRADITRVRVSYSSGVLTYTVRYRDLRPMAVISLESRITTGKLRDFGLEVLYSNTPEVIPRGVTTIFRHGRVYGIDCDKLVANFDFKRNTIRVKLGSQCFGSPPSLRIGIGTTVRREETETGTYYRDDALRRGRARYGNYLLSQRIMMSN